ncbi:MAG: hypothetical protein KJ066_07705 [Acidobacteria bacterium]|nr:hypothetical protein [Acidobacteriota bacterium]
MPILSRPWIVASALAYVVITLAIGWWAMRRTKTAADFFVAGRNLGLAVTGLAAMSAAYSGFAFLGGPGLTYRLGAGAFFICFPVGFTAALICWSVAKRLRLIAEVRRIYTVPDVLHARFRSRTTAGLGALAIVVGTVGYLGAQVLALGIVVEAVFGTKAWAGEWSLPVAMTLGATVLLAYSVAGGMVAGVYTDLFQGVTMLVVGVAVFGHVLAVTGGIETMAASIVNAPALGRTFLDPVGRAGVWLAFGLLFTFGVGCIGQPHVIHKFLMLRDPRDLKWMPLVLGGGQSLCILLWVGVGLAVPALVAQGRLAPLANPDEATVAYLLGFAPEFLAGLVLASVLAAIMSTADSFTNIAAAALVRDLPTALGRPLRDELYWGRVATLVTTLAAGAVAYFYGDLIALLGAFSFGTLGAALTPALALGLNWRRVNATAASASIATGATLNVTLEFFARQTFFAGLPSLPFAAGVQSTAVSLAVSFAVLIFVTLATSRADDEVDEDVRLVMEM